MRLTIIIDAAGHKTIWSGSSDDFNVFLCGSFNDWKTTVTQMEKTRLVYLICIELPMCIFLLLPLPLAFIIVTALESLKRQ